MIMDNTDKIMYGLMKDRDDLIQQMEEKLKSVQRDINTINLIRKLKH